MAMNWMLCDWQAYFKDTDEWNFLVSNNKIALLENIITILGWKIWKVKVHTMKFSYSI
jgi:hypothetical protein